MQNTDLDQAGMSAGALRRLTDFIRADVDSGAIPGAVIWIARRGALACFEAIGFAERSTQRPMQHDSIFRIASMTKPVTAVAAMMPPKWRWTRAGGLRAAADFPRRHVITRASAACS